MIDNIFVWNIRGLGTSKSQVRKLIRKFDISILVISESFQSVENLQKWSRSIGFPRYNSHMETGGKVWIYWKEEVEMDLVGISNQAITGLFSKNGVVLLGTFVYAKCNHAERKDLWDHLSGISGVGTDNE